MPAKAEELKKKVLNDLEERGLKYALETLRYESFTRLKLDLKDYIKLKIWLIKEFLQRKDARIEDWRDEDLDGISDILKDSDVPYDLRLEVFRNLLAFYSKAREQIGSIIGSLSPGTIASKAVKGLIILMENFEFFAEVKKPEKVPFPSVQPPDPRPPENKINEIIRIVGNSKQVLLVGPPGSGKTHLAMWAAHELAGAGQNGLWVLVQFHRSYRYDDFVERMVLRPRGGSVELVVEPQIFVKLCRYAQQNPGKRVVLVIDELNRADVASVFGELIYGLEYRGYPVKLAYSDDYLIIPENLYIIATANDIDRGTFDIGVALRRRFEVVRIYTDENALRDLLRQQGAPDDVIEIAADIFNRVNKLFEGLIGRKGLGHLFFRGVKDKQSLVDVWRFRIRPLIEAYFLAPGIMGREAQQIINDIEKRLQEPVVS